MSYAEIDLGGGDGAAQLVAALTALLRRAELPLVRVLHLTLTNCPGPSPSPHPHQVRVLHLAGSYARTPLAEATAESFAEATRAKALGAVQLHEAALAVGA